MQDVVELCRALVRAKSPSGHEEPAIAVIAEALSAGGHQPVISGRNIYAVRGKGPRRLLLNSHSDTVPDSKDWTIDPWAAELRDGKVHGLGANDAKGPLAGMIRAFLTATIPADAALVIAATCDEETGGLGLGTLKPELPAFDASIVGEPSALNVCCAQRGMLRLRLIAKGKRAHASRPWQGENAIEKAGRDIVKIQAIPLGEAHPLLGPPTLQVTMIHGGVKTNVIPPECVMEIDSRTLPTTDNAMVEAWVRAAVESEVIKVSDRYQPVSTPIDEPIVRAALAATGATEAIAFGGVSDLFYIREKPGIVLGPGRSEQSHAADEWIEIDMLERGERVYRETIERYFAMA
jgi:acetylornithine deacetylase